MSSEAAHSSYSPSKRDRWSQCPGSIRMESAYPNETSEAASEGIEAHAMLESLMKNNGEHTTTFAINDDINQGHVINSYNHVKKLINDLLMQGLRVQVNLEQRVSITEDVFGTADIIIVAERYGHKQWLLERLYVIDYKHGRIRVEAKDNKQLEFYAVAAYVEMEEDIQFSPTCELHFWILQPKVNYHPVTHAIINDVNDWLVDTHSVIMEEVNRAKTHHSAYTRAGTWCTFCKASGNCRTYADYMDEVIESFGSV